MADIISSNTSENTNIVILGLTPQDTSGRTMNVVQVEDETLFVLKGKEDLYAQNKLMFPSLSHG